MFKNKNLYIIRHGETDYNRMGMVQGSGIDSSLNELGLLQAEKFYQFYKNHPFEKIYTSKLQRTVQTVAPFLEKNIPHETHSGLNEISWGAREGKLPTKEDTKELFEMIKKWEEGHVHLSFENAESPLEVQVRQQQYLQYLKEFDTNENILICMHGRAMRIFLCTLLNLPLSQMDTFGHTNVSLYHVQFNNYLPKILKNNCTLHLNGLK